jgi:hypothetical protein
MNGRIEIRVIIVLSVSVYHNIDNKQFHGWQKSLICQPPETKQMLSMRAVVQVG